MCGLGPAPAPCQIQNRDRKGAGLRSRAEARPALTRLIEILAPHVISLLQLMAWLLLLAVIFVPLERCFPRRPQHIFRRAFHSDLIYYFLSSVLPKFLLIPPMTAVAWLLHRAMPGGIYPAVAAMPLLARLAAAQIVGEIGSYWAHRWMHQVPLLWRFHSLHHSAEEMDWLVNTRAHPVDLVLTRFCALAPMYALGLAQPLGNGIDAVPVVVTILGTIWGFFIHSNLNWRFGWLEWLVSSPAFHHWHHTLGPEHVNQNYAPMLPLVDRLFGTYYLPRDQWPPAYGTDTPIPLDMSGQLLEPFALSVTEALTEPRPSGSVLNEN
jgi:sterol desaturase/sphingolipid hydroxylase (fatty acid hydroxylase superfamily)